MRKGVIKAVILSMLFGAAVVVFSYMTNQTNEDLTMEMADATLPVITLYHENTPINELHGYLAEMDAAYMRDTITPIGEDRKLPVKIKTYQTPVDTISYEIRSLDAERLIANADVTSYKAAKGNIELTLTIQNLLETGEEYLFILNVGSGDKTIRYYTRIEEAADCHVAECVDFVKDFHNTTFNKETVGTLSTYLEHTTGDNSTLQYTTLNNSLNQIGWANLGGERLGMPVPSIKEITSTYTVVVLDYVMTRVGEGGESEYYNVEEYYRVRYTAQRMYLLNFERTVNQIFRGENDSFYDTFIQLGIRADDVEYMTDEAGNIVAFVQEGELWVYNQNENTLAKVFSFRGYEGIDERENFGEHDIKIVDIDEAGSLDYIVYGYMNRGVHEGEVGIAVYHYDSIANTNEEEVFLPSAQSYEVMKSELGQLMYVNDGGMFYLMVDGNIYGIDLNILETNELVSDLKEGSFAVSESNRFFAWIDPKDELGSSRIQILDLQTEKTFEVTGGSSEYLKPLGFMKEDFVYGIVKKQDVLEDAAGKITFPMYQVKIMDTASEQHELLKTYEKPGYYVSDIVINGFTMYLNRIQFNGTAYVDADQDMIMNREGDSQKLIDIQKTSTREKQTEVQILLAKKVNGKTPKILNPKEIIQEEKREVVLEKEKDGERYYVYVKGDVILTTDDVADAVKTANERMGVVIGSHQQYVWKRARKNSQNAFEGMVVGEEDKNAGSIIQCINVMLEREGINISVSALVSQGQKPKEILENALKDVSVLDLSGCNVDEILYYISNGAPVFAMTGANDAVLLIGYDANNISIYDPALNLVYRKTQEEADKLFEEAGSIFFTYLK